MAKFGDVGIALAVLLGCWSAAALAQNVEPAPLSPLPGIFTTNEALPLPPARANPDMPNGFGDNGSMDVLQDPDTPPDLGAADDLSGPGDEDQIPNE